MINCVIVKDLSRFGRESIEGGRYMEKMFPAMGVRLISIVENIDTLHTDAATSFIIPVKNLINDTYCRDTSIKVRSHFDVKRRNGEFIGSWAAYGYRKDPENKNHLVVDEEAAGHVRDIFAWRIAGQSCQSIADWLNSLGVLSPMGVQARLRDQIRLGLPGTRQAPVVGCGGAPYPAKTPSTWASWSRASGPRPTTR